MRKQLYFVLRKTMRQQSGIWLISARKAKNQNYCVRVTANDGALGDQYLREFQDNEKTIPAILTTSQKLSTGVDARNIRNIVLYVLSIV